MKWPSDTWEWGDGMSDNRYQDRKRDNPQIWRWAVVEDTDLRTIDRGYNATRAGAELALAAWNYAYAPRRFRIIDRASL